MRNQNIMSLAVRHGASNGERTLACGTVGWLSIRTSATYVWRIVLHDNFEGVETAHRSDDIAYCIFTCLCSSIKGREALQYIRKILYQLPSTWNIHDALLATIHHPALLLLPANIMYDITVPNRKHPLIPLSAPSRHSCPVLLTPNSTRALSETLMTLAEVLPSVQSSPLRLPLLPEESQLRIST